MADVDLKALLSKLNAFCVSMLQNAAGLSVSRTHYEVTLEHLLLKMLDETQSDLALILRHFDVDQGRLSAALADTLEDFRTGNAAKPVFSPILVDHLMTRLYRKMRRN